MRLYLVQSRETGQFLIPSEGYVGWTQSLRQALDLGLIDYETACELRDDHTDHADVIFLREEHDFEIRQ